MTRRRLPRNDAQVLDAAILLDGEITWDSTNKAPRFGDGETVGGIRLNRGSGTVSLLDKIPVVEWGSILGRTSTTDHSGYFQAALDELDTKGGGKLELPAGLLNLDASITIPKKITIEGCGFGTQVNVRHAGHAFRTISPINGSTSIWLNLFNFAIVCTNNGSIGGMYYDQAGTYIKVRDMVIRGGKYGVILDQSELADIADCIIEVQTYAGVWLLNGTDLNGSAIGGFTNRISISRCQFNNTSVAGRYAILDHGGYAHSYRDNNYNGWHNHIYLGNSIGFIIDGGEFESAHGACLKFHYLPETGLGTGFGNAFGKISGGLYSATPGNYCIEVLSAGSLMIDGGGVFASGGLTLSSVSGAGNIGNLMVGNVICTHPLDPFLDSSAAIQRDLRKGNARPVAYDLATIDDDLSLEGLLIFGGYVGTTTLTLRKHVDIPHNLGAQIKLLVTSASTTMRVAGVTGVTLVSESSHVASNVVGSVITITNIAPDTWLIEGARIT